VRKFLNGVHVCTKFHENWKGWGFFFVDLAWNDPIVGFNKFPNGPLDSENQLANLKFKKCQSSSPVQCVNSNTQLQSINAEQRTQNQLIE